MHTLVPDTTGRLLSVNLYSTKLGAFISLGRTKLSNWGDFKFGSEDSRIRNYNYVYCAYLLFWNT